MKFIKKVDLLIVGILGFITSCTEPESTFAYYEINGTITDSITSQPLSNIRIVRKETDYILFPDTMYTDSVGQYRFSFVDNYSKKPSFYIKVEDADGMLNSGDFLTRELNVKFSSLDWVMALPEKEYYGKAIKTYNIKLQAK